MTCFRFDGAQVFTQANASYEAFGHPTQVDASRRKLASVLFPFVRGRVQGCTEMALLLLGLNFRLLASPFGHPSQVCDRKFTFPNLR